MKFPLLTKDNTLLLVVDIQERLLKIMDPDITKQVNQNVQLLLKMFKKWNAPILVTEQYVKGLGYTTEALKPYLEGITPIEKVAFSCCGSSEFNEALQEHGQHYVVVTGMETHICVLQTVAGLLDQGFHPIVAVDAVQSSSKLKWKTAIEYFQNRGVTVLPTESILFQMLQRADHEDFKFFVNCLKEMSS